MFIVNMLLHHLWCFVDDNILQKILENDWSVFLFLIWSDVFIRKICLDYALSLPLKYDMRYFLSFWLMYLLTVTFYIRLRKTGWISEKETWNWLFLYPTFSSSCMYGGPQVPRIIKHARNFKLLSRTFELLITDNWTCTEF